MYVDNSIGQNIHRKLDEDEIQDEEEKEAGEPGHSKKDKKKEKKEKSESKHKGGDKSKKPKQQQAKKEAQFKCGEGYRHFYEGKTEISFLVDNMLHKLALYMRNVGLDAEFLAEKDHKNLTELAKTEKRVILTRDQRYFERADDVPCLFIQDQKTPDQFKEIIDFFKLTIDEANFLKRCVKCNDTEIVEISKEEAKKNLNWKNEEDYEFYDQFWQCAKCKQIYWEGITFKNAKKRFAEFVDSENSGTNTEENTEKSEDK